MAGRLSFLQEQTLIALHRGRREWNHPRAVAGLIQRGLVELGDWTLGDNLTLRNCPQLTGAGAAIAAELDAADRRRSFERKVRGSRFGVIEGGIA